MKNAFPFRFAAAPVCAALLLSGSAVVRADTDGTIRRTFDAAPGGRLVVEVSGARVNVVGTSGSQVDIVYTRIVGAGSPADEEQILAEHTVTMEQSGNTISIIERGQDSNGGGLGSFIGSLLRGRVGVHKQYELTVEVPRQFKLDLRTSGGRIDVGEIEGSVQVRTSGGRITLHHIAGNVDGRTSGGGIDLDSVEGYVTVRTSGGGIDSVNTHGSLSLRTSGGSISIDEHQGNVDGRTSGGSIRATLVSQPEGDSTLTTSGGSISVIVPADIAANIDASTSGGSVRSDLPVTVQGEMDRNRLVGKLNGGGPELRLHTSGGSIRINRGSDTAVASTGR